MEGQIVEFTGQIEELKLDHLKLFINDLGGQISVQKQLKFEDLGLAEVEKGIFQCLVCSKVIKRKDNAVTHFKKLHTDQAELTCQCPRCDIEIPKSKLNQHMDQAHGIKMFNQLIKQNFQPDTPRLRPFLDNDPLTTAIYQSQILFQEDFNNNDVKTEQESEEKIESEKIVSDLKINNDFNDIKTELVDEEFEEKKDETEKVLPSAEMTFESGATPKKPGLKVRKDMYKKKSMNTKAGSSLKNKKKE